MSHDKNDPLDPIEVAREEEYIRRHEQELIEKLRRNLKNEATAEGIKAATGITDAELLTHLAELGIDRDNIRSLHLVPLVQVAWADGEIAADELDLLLAAAAEAGVVDGPARALFDAMLQKPPSKALYDNAMRYINALVKALPEAEAAKATENLAELAYRVADANGGIFGLFGRVEDSEKVVLRDIATRLAESRPAAAKKLLDRL